MKIWEEDNLLRRVRESDTEKKVSYNNFIEEFVKLSNKYSNSGISITFNDIFTKENPVELKLSFGTSELKIKDESDIEEARILANNLMRVLKDCENFKYLGYIVSFS